MAFAWVLAVFVNVIVWAHHIYLDYPKGSIQSALNTSMQPLTFAITLPSAISLYSLSADDLALGLPVDPRGQVPGRGDGELAGGRPLRG